MATSAYSPISAQTAETAVDGSTLLEEGLQDLPGSESLPDLPKAETLPAPVAGYALMQVSAPATLPEGYDSLFSWVRCATIYPIRSKFRLGVLRRDKRSPSPLPRLLLRPPRRLRSAKAPRR
jgi:hypothetical protein